MTENSTTKQGSDLKLITHRGRVLNWYRLFNQMDHVGDLEAPTVEHERIHLKMALIAEEFSELVDAVYGQESGTAVREGFLEAVKLDAGERDIVEAADATSDLRFVIEGFDLEAGIDGEAVFEAVCQSNLSKLDPETGEPILSDGTDGKPLGKILKGSDFFEPTAQIAAIVKADRGN